MKIDGMGNEYCECCGQDTKLSPANQRSENIQKWCLWLAIFFAGMFVGVFL